MFNHERTLDVLRDFKHLGRRKRKNVMDELLFDPDFIKWLFQPEDIPNLTGVVTDFYEEFTKIPTMQAMIDVVDEYGFEDFDRSHATFFTSVANIGIQTNNDALYEIEHSRKSGEISRKDSRDLVADIDLSNELIIKLMKYSKKIVKRKAKNLAKDSGLPKYITLSAFTSIPDPKYIDTFKIGYYLNNLFTTIYSDVEEMGGFDNHVKWRVFFKDIFGEKNLADVATFILLEGSNRIEKYSSEDVKECWDTLTVFALQELNDTPGAVRDQMIELYIKRLDKMFGGALTKGTNSLKTLLRINLLDLDDIIYPKLANTVSKYASRLKKILSRD